MIFYLIDRKPFREKFDLIQQVYFELIGLAVNISVLVNATEPDENFESNPDITRIGKFVIVMNMLYNFTLAFLMFLQILLFIKKQSQAYKLKRNNRRVAHLKVTRRQINESAVSSEPIHLEQTISITERQQSSVPLEISINNSLSSERSGNLLAIPRGRSNVRLMKRRRFASDA